MKVESFEAVARTLQGAGVRYLVAGGLAVNAHGYLRLTHDVDLVVKLDAGNIVSAFAALASIGYKPLVPITAEQFANGEMRARWIAEKGMKVLNFFSDLHRETPLDVFVTEPFDFEREAAECLNAEFSPGFFVPFVSIPTMIAMKGLAARPRDLDDIQHLRWIQEDLDRRGSDS